MMDNILLGNRIEERRTEIGLSLNDVANRVGVARSTVQRYEKGKIQKIKLAVVQSIAECLRVNPSWLIGKSEQKFQLGEDQNQFPQSHRIPILGRVAAGAPILAAEEIIGYTFTTRNGGAEYFGLLVAGDSMNATTIIDGSIVIVRRQEQVDDGQVAVVVVDGEDATVKRFYQAGHTVTLMPQSNNPAHKPQIYDLRKIDINIIGRVVEVTNNIE